MQKFINIVFLSCAFLYTNISLAAPVILKPTTPPAPTTFSTVNGVIGLNSESLSGGDISISAGSYSQTIPLDASGNFSLLVAANNSFSINAKLSFDSTLPDVNMAFSNYTALPQGEIQTLDLTRPSGRLLGRVTVVGGNAQNLSLFANASRTTNGITELYTANANAEGVGNPSAEALLAFPAAITSNVSGRVQILTTNGCMLSESLAPKSITLNDRALGTTDPDMLEWTVDVTGASCKAGSVSGEYRLNGLDTSVILNQHELTFFGETVINQNFTAFGLYRIDPILEGQYSTSQTSFFNEPYSSLRFPNENLTITGDSIYNAIYSVGMSHGNVELSGDWNFSQTKAANIEAYGSVPGSTSDSMSAFDVINPTDGSFDFVLGSGSWRANQYTFDFESLVNTRNDRESLNIELLQDNLLNSQDISEGSVVNLSPVSLLTATAQIDLLVEQVSGQPQVTIDRLFINGNSDLLDPVSNTVYGKSSIRADSSGTSETGFQITVYGFPGTYTLTARGTGSDGRTYSATFDVTLGNVTPPDDEPESMACFGINKVKLHQHDEYSKYGYSKDKLYIKYAGFRLPEDAVVDLANDDVAITIDGKVYDFPAGTFTQSHDKQNYHFKSASGQLPQIKADINFDKAKWSLKINKEDTSYIDNTDGVDITLSIAGYSGSENVVLKSKNKHHDKLMYKRKPKIDCRIKDKNKHYKDHDSDEDDDEDKDGGKGKDKDD